MKHKMLLNGINVLVFLLSTFNSVSQSLTIQWQKCYGGSALESAFSLQKTIDGGYIVGGQGSSNDGDVTGNHGNADYWLVKVDSQGIINWQRSYGGSGFDQMNCIRNTTDRGYIASGRTLSNNGDVVGHHGSLADYWIIKLDSVGNIVWQKALGGAGNDICFGIEQSIGGGYIAVGISESTDGDVMGNHGMQDCWVVKLDSIGNIVWQKSYGGTKNDAGYMIQQTTDSGYIICGHSYSTDGDVTGGYSGRTAWIIKIDSTGNIQWQKSYGSKSSILAEDELMSVKQTSDGYVLAGQCEIDGVDITGTHGGTDAWVIKLDNTGNLVWQKPLGGTVDDKARSIIQTSDEGYIVGCSTKSNDFDVSGNHGMQDVWIVKLSATGALEWQKCIGGTALEAIADMYLTSDNGLIVAATTLSNNDGDVGPAHGMNDYWLVKMVSSETVPITLGSFDALLKEKLVLCKWQTQQEMNSNHFVIERSSDAINYIDIGRVVASGKSSIPVNYNFTDQTPFSTAKEYLYYRLKMVDNDGSFTYSNTLKVKLKYNSLLNFYPNPVNNHLLISFNSLTSEKAVIAIIDQIGRKIYQQEVLIKQGNNSFTLKTSQLASSIYFLSINGKTNYSAKFLKSN